MALCSKELSQNSETLLLLLTTHWLDREVGDWSLLPEHCCLQTISGFSLGEERENRELKGSSSIGHILLYATENSFIPTQHIFQPLETGVTKTPSLPSVADMTPRCTGPMSGVSS